MQYTNARFDPALVIAPTNLASLLSAIKLHCIDHIQDNVNLTIVLCYVQEELNNLQSIHPGESSQPNVQTEGAPSIVAANLLSMIDKPNSINPSENLEARSTGDPNAKLQQFLDTSPRTDVAETVLSMNPVTMPDKGL